MTAISNFGLNLTLATSLQSQQTALSILSQQLATSQKHSNLTDYAPTDAHNILDFQNAITQRQSYLASMQTVQTRLSLYDTTMTDIESMAAQASSLATQNQSYDPLKAADIQAQATSYLSQLGNDLNQQIGGRYIYAGARYSTQPVVDLNALTGAPTATTTTSPALPSYDTNYSNATSFGINSGKTPSGAFTMGNTTIAWSQLENPTSPIAVTVNGTSHSIAVAGLSTAATPTAYAANLSLTLNAIAGSAYADPAGVPSTLTTTASTGTLTMNFNGGAPVAVTPDASGTSGEITWVGGSTPDGTVAQTPNSSVPAYTNDSVLVDSSYNITYGVSSNDPSFQKLVNGLRFISAAVTAGKGGDPATYKADMLQATSLISAGLAGLQALHAGVANNQNTLTNVTTAQNTDITSLQNELSDIQKVDLAQVGTEINLLQTQLQASYSSTASLEQLSIVKYL